MTGSTSSEPGDSPRVTMRVPVDLEASVPPSNSTIGLIVPMAVAQGFGDEVERRLRFWPE